MADVDFIPRPPSRSPRCPCGWRDRYAPRSRHAHWHLSWAVGVPVPASLPWPEESIAVIHRTSPVAWRRVAYQCARIAQRDGGYDFPTFPAPIGRGEDSKEHNRAACYRTDEGVVGYLAVADLPTRGSWDFAQPNISPVDDNRVRPCIVLAFTAFNWRQRGIARGLVEAAAEHAGVSPADLAWNPPFSAAGKELARSFARPDGQVWVA